MRIREGAHSCRSCSKSLKQRSCVDRLHRNHSGQLLDHSGSFHFEISSPLSSEHVAATHGAYHDIGRAGQSCNNLIGEALDAFKNVRVDRRPDKAEIVVQASSHDPKKILECLWTMGKDAFDWEDLGACVQGLA